MVLMRLFVSYQRDGAGAGTFAAISLLTSVLSVVCVLRMLLRRDADLKADAWEDEQGRLIADPEF